MTTPWTPPPRSYHLRAFGLALVIVVLCLFGILFGVRMEAITHATGVFEAVDQQELRATAAGVVELGWYEGEVALGGGPARVRVDRSGNGLVRTAASAPRVIEHYKLRGEPDLARDRVTFHKLEPGDTLWPGQPMAHIQAEDLVQHLASFGERWPRAPRAGQAWLVARVSATNGARLSPGDPLVTLVPIDPGTGQPSAVKAVLDIDERHAAYVEAGQNVRLYSAMYSQRLFGHADAVIERLEPNAAPVKAGERVFRAHAKIVHAPFPLRLGSSVKAEIVVGKKQIYRVILEQ